MSKSTVDLIKDAYPGYGLDLDNIKVILNRFPDRFIRVGDSLAVFLRLSDSNFIKLKTGLLNLCDAKILLSLFMDNGDNIHVISVVANGLRELRVLEDLLQGKTLSWFKPDMSRLVVFERS